MRKLILLLFSGLVYSGALAQDPGSPQNQLMEEGRALMEEGNYSKAAEIYSKIIQATGGMPKEESTPGSSYFEALYSRAVCFYYLDESDKAIADLDLFLANIPSFPQAYLLKSIIYQRQQRFEEQLNTLNLALPFFKESDKHKIFRLRAGAFLGLEKIDSALIDLRVALSAEEDAEGLSMLGLIQYKKGNFDSALVSLNKAIGLDHSYITTYRYAVSFCLEQGQYEMAITYINLGLLAEPEMPELLFLKGVILQEWGQTDEACRLLNRAFYAGVDDAGDYLTEYCYPTER